MAEQEAMAWQEAEADGTWQGEENCRDNQPDKRPKEATAAKGKGGGGDKSSNGGGGGAGTRGDTQSQCGPGVQTGGGCALSAPAFPPPPPGGNGRYSDGNEEA